MNIVIRCRKRALLLLLFVAAILLPLSAKAQTISVTPNSVDVQTNVGSNASSQILQVRNRAPGPPSDRCAPGRGVAGVADRIADERREQQFADPDVPDVGVGGAVSNRTQPRFRSMVRRIRLLST